MIKFKNTNFPSYNKNKNNETKQNVMFRYVIFVGKIRQSYFSRSFTHSIIVITLEKNFLSPNTFPDTFITVT